MNNKRPFVPAFLQKFDDKLLRNKPLVWSARTHLVLYFSLVFGAILTTFCFLVFFDARQYSTISGWSTFVGLIAFIGFVFWVIFLLRFNVFKRYGNWQTWDGITGFALYFISIGLMVAVCFIPSAIETLRANQQFGNNEIVTDINDLNLTACRLEYAQLPKAWHADTCKVVDDKKDMNDREAVVVEADNYKDSVVYVDKKIFHTIDTAELRTKIFNADSVFKVSDSMYVFNECPDYAFVSSYGADKYADKKILRSKDIYYAAIKNYQPPNRADLLKKMDAFKKKYAADSRYAYYENDLSYNDNDSYDTKIRKLYSLRKINNGIDNAVGKKYAWLNDWDVYLRVFYYITLVLTLLVFIFRHTTVKTFFLSLLTAVILFIFTGLMMLVSYNGSESGVLSFMIIYFIVFTILALSVFGIRVRKAIQGIGLNLCFFMTPFIPLIFVTLNMVLKVSNYNNRGIGAQPERDHTMLYLTIAEIAGSILLLVLIEPLFRKLYRKWYAAPEV
jgi:hypothetical protein